MRFLSVALMNLWLAGGLVILIRGLVVKAFAGKPFLRCWVPALFWPFYVLHAKGRSKLLWILELKKIF
jgi:hypothetical protein